VKLCQDCRWVRIGDRNEPEQAICSHPTSVYQPSASPVTGKREAVHQLRCSQVRRMDRRDARPGSPESPTDDYGLPTDPCGPDGEHWEPVAPGFT